MSSTTGTTDTNSPRNEIKLESQLSSRLISSSYLDFICSGGLLSSGGQTHLIATPYQTIIKKVENSLKSFANSAIAPGLSLSPSQLRLLVESAREDQLKIRDMDRIEYLQQAMEALNTAITSPLGIGKRTK